jgi:hypothetical protein
LRKAIVREWAIIPDQVKSNLSNYLIHYVVNGGTNLQTPVRNQLLICYAMIIKLSWLEKNSTKQDCIDTVQKLLQNSDWSVKVIGMNVLATLVSEFSGQHNKSSQIGMSWEFHERCRVAFQSDLLPQCFEFAIAIMRELVRTNHQSEPIAKAAIKLLNEVLTWDFSLFDQRSTLRRTAVQVQKKELPAMIQPKSEYWCKALTTPDLVTHIINFHLLLRSHPLLSHLTLQALVQICSVSQKSFADNQAKVTLLPHILNGIFGILHTALSDSLDNVGDEVYHLCLCLFRVLSNFGLSTLLLVSNFGEISQKLCGFTIQIVQFSAFNYDDWFFDSMEQLFDMWAALVDSLEITQNVPDTVANGLKSCCTSIFSAYVESRLRFGKSLDAEDEEDERTLDEQLTALASLGRQDPAQTLGVLNTKLTERLNMLQQVMNSNNSTSIETLWNDLDGLFQITGYLLADDNAGETPVIPSSINKLTQQANGKIYFDLIDNIFKFGEFEAHCLNNGIQQLSPYIGEQVMWFFVRWSRSYLMTDTAYYADFSKSLTEKYGIGTESGRNIIYYLLNKILLNLFKWQGEPSLASVTCKLLTTLANNKNICKCLGQIEIWKQLISADKDTYQTLSNQQDDIKASLIEGLVLGCTHMANNDQEIGTYLTQLLVPVNTYFSSIVDRQEFNSDYQTPQVLSQVSYCLEKLLGIVRASVDKNIKLLFQFFAETKIFEKLVALVHKYHNHSQIVLLILKFFEEIAKAQIANLSVSETKLLSQASLEVIKAYRKYNAGRKWNGPLGTDAQEDHFLDVLTLINILTHIVSKDFLDFNESGYGEVKIHNEELDVSMIVFMGLNLILPLITLDMLQFPKLCMHYFTLVTFMFEIYPAKVAMLPPDLFQQLLSSLEFGIKHHKSKVARLSFEALKSMADYNVRNNRIPFKQQEEHNKHIVAYLLQSIFKLVMLELFSDELLEAMAEALFALMLWDEQQYQSVVNSFIENEKDQTNRQRLIEAFGSLREGLTPELNRENERKFVENTGRFLLNVRTFMRRN